MAAAAPASTSTSYNLTLAELFKALGIKDPLQPHSGGSVEQFRKDLVTEPKLTLKTLESVIRNIKERNPRCTLQLSFISDLERYPSDHFEIPGLLPLAGTVTQFAYNGEKSLLALVLKHDLAALPAYFSLVQNKIRPVAKTKHSFFYDDIPPSLFSDVQKFSDFLSVFGRDYNVEELLVSDTCRPHFFTATASPEIKEARKRVVEQYAWAVAGAARHPPLTSKKVEFERKLPYLYLKYLLTPEEVVTILRAGPGPDRPYFYWAALLEDAQIEKTYYSHFCSAEAFVPFYWLLRQKTESAVALLQAYCAAKGGVAADVSFMHRDESWSLLVEAFYWKKEEAVLAVLSQQQRLQLARQITRRMVFYTSSDGELLFHERLLHFCARTLDQETLDRLLPEDASLVAIHFKNPPALNAVLYKRLCTVPPKPEEEKWDLRLQRYFLKMNAYYEAGKLNPTQTANYDQRLRHFLSYLKWCATAKKNVQYLYPALEEELASQGLLNRLHSNGYANLILKLDAARRSAVSGAKVEEESYLYQSCCYSTNPLCEHSRERKQVQTRNNERYQTAHIAWTKNLFQHCALLKQLAPHVYWRLVEIMQDPSSKTEAVVLPGDTGTPFPEAPLWPRGMRTLWELIRTSDGSGIGHSIEGIGAEAFMTFCIHTFFLHARVATDFPASGVTALLEHLQRLLEGGVSAGMRALLSAEDEGRLTILQRFCSDDGVRTIPKEGEGVPELFLWIERHYPDLIYARDIPAHSSPRTRQAYATSYTRTRGLAQLCQFLERRPVFDPARHSVDFKTYLASLEPHLIADAAPGNQAHALGAAFWKLHFCLMRASGPLSFSFSFGGLSPYATALDILAKLTLALESDQPMATAVEQALVGRGEGAAAPGSPIEVAETFCATLRDAAAAQQTGLEQMKTLFRHYLVLLQEINPRLFKDLEQQRNGVKERRAAEVAAAAAATEAASAAAVLKQETPAPVSALGIVPVSSSGPGGGGLEPTAPPLPFNARAMNDVSLLAELRQQAVGQLVKELAEICTEEEWRRCTTFLGNLRVQAKKRAGEKDHSSAT